MLRIDAKPASISSPTRTRPSPVPGIGAQRLMPHAAAAPHSGNPFLRAVHARMPGMRIVSADFLKTTPFANAQKKAPGRDPRAFARPRKIGCRSSVGERSVGGGPQFLAFAAGRAVRACARCQAAACAPQVEQVCDVEGMRHGSRCELYMSSRGRRARTIRSRKSRCNPFLRRMLRCRRTVAITRRARRRSECGQDRERARAIRNGCGARTVLSPTDRLQSSLGNACLQAK